MSSPQTYYSFPPHLSHQSSKASPAPASYRPLSPPESNAGTTASSSNMYSTPSAYAGSSASAAASDYGTSSTPSSSGIDLMDLLNDKLAGSFDPTPLDRGLVQQAQTSGALNAKHRELAALQAQARARLVSSRANFADGMKAAREVRADLEWTGKRVAQLKTKAKGKYPSQYGRAEAVYALPVDC